MQCSTFCFFAGGGRGALGAKYWVGVENVGEGYIGGGGAIGLGQSNVWFPPSTWQIGHHANPIP